MVHSCVKFNIGGERRELPKRKRSNSEKGPGSENRRKRRPRELLKIEERDVESCRKKKEDPEELQQEDVTEEIKIIELGVVEAQELRRSARGGGSEVKHARRGRLSGLVVAEGVKDTRRRGQPRQSGTVKDASRRRLSRFKRSYRLVTCCCSKNKC